MFAVRGGRGGGGGKDIDDEDKKWEVMHQTMIEINVIHCVQQNCDFNSQKYEIQMLTFPNNLVRLKSLSCKGNWITEKNYNCFYKTLETLIKYFGIDYIQDNL